MKFFKVHRLTIYAWFYLWESGGIEALHKKPGQGRRPKLSPTNPHHVECAKAAVESERQNLKTVVAKLSAELAIEMHPDPLKRFLKNLATLFRKFRKCFKARQDASLYNEGKINLQRLQQLCAGGHLDLYYADESTFSMNPCLPYGWQAKGETIGIVPHTNQKINVFGYGNNSN